MNCIFCCVFSQKKYVDMFLILLESILLYGNLDNKTDILVYTSTEFMNLIKHSSLFNDKIKFEINDTYNNIGKACYSRLDLFRLASIQNFDKILYLDTDILVKDDINKVFNICKDDILYVLEEGEIDNPLDYWGRTLFRNNFHIYGDKTAFTSGILLFNNCEKIKFLFEKINEDIICRPYNFACYDQPYIVYNAFKYNLYNNKILKSLVVNSDTNIYSNKVIHHFPGGPGCYQHKIDTMTTFLNGLKKGSKITKILFQTNKTRMNPQILNMIMNKLGSDWKYEFYDDDDVMRFFNNNPIQDLPGIINKYNSFKKGAHKADLFRYYYLYVKGGFFMDSDAMLYVNIDNIARDYDFVSVDSSCHPGTIFQGILGASPKNEIIKRALYAAYNVDPSLLDKNYHYFCKQLYNIIKEKDYGYNIKLYQERRVPTNNWDDILDGKTVIFKHYWRCKIIPLEPTNFNNYNNNEMNKTNLCDLTECKNINLNETDWNNYNRSELNKFDYNVLNTYKIDKSLVRIGPKEDGGYVIVDGLDYDLFISCGIANDIRFELAFLQIYKINCIAFDGTIQQIPPHDNNNIKWIKQNIGHSNTEKTTNLKEYIQNKTKIFLKMDIEGSEFNWIDSMTESELDQFSQIVIEVHWPFDIYRMNMLKKLNKTHYIVHMHGNNYCDRDIPKNLPSGRTYDGTVTIDNGIMPKIKLPEVFEVTYINKKICNKGLVEMKEIKFPTMLDYPNNPNAPEMHFSIPINNTMNNCTNITTNLANKTYSWGNSYIKFLDNFKMDAFGDGSYQYIDNQNIIAQFGGRTHNITFNTDFTTFISTRFGDLDTVIGELQK